MLNGDHIEQPLLSQAEVAKLLGVSERTVYNMRRQGKLQARKIGERVVFDPADLKAFLESCREEV